MSRRTRSTQPLPEILAELARLATEDLSLRPMLQRVADALAGYFQWQLVALVSIDRQSNRFVCEALSTSLPTDIHVGYSRELGSGVVGEVAATGRPVLVSDASQYPNFVHTLPGGQSELCVPILFRGTVIAVLNLESTEVGTFDGSLDLLKTISEQIAGTIAGARRVEELTRRTQLLEVVAEFTRQAMESEDLDALLGFVLRSLAARFQTVESTVLLEGDLVGHLEVAAHLGASPHITYRGKQWPINEGVVGRCFREGVLIYVDDVSKDPHYSTVNPSVRAELALPISLKGRVFGVLNLEAETSQPFSGENRVLLRALADAVAGAIHLLSTAHRLQQSQARAERQAVELGRARENLRRATGKLDRRQGEQAVFGLSSSTQFRKQLKAQCRAVSRGGRGMALWLIRINPHSYVDAIRLNEIITPYAARIANFLVDANIPMCQLRPRSLGVLLSGAPSVDSRKRIEECLQALHRSYVGDTELMRAEPSHLVVLCKLSQAKDPEGFLDHALAQLDELPDGVLSWLDAHHP
ncbi:hypothetical protein C7S18_04860 [Ahniella affigens]|uniref:GAF domain-containing protein n=1 Tax=Ahniella affigens TaxID=2021234 RepID=A0A2P1PP05_9GAMM|nr:GAF domain-containing protein [Ahniella affigens]AVP96572.1 hypothetical protein C7S18_04860 [Ahniella affigens]